MEIKVCKQKIKHLLFEKETNSAEMKAEKMVRMGVNIEKGVHQPWQ